jgi:hypothetical protein
MVRPVQPSADCSTHNRNNNDKLVGEESQLEAEKMPRAPLTSAPLNMLMAFFAPPIVAITTSAVAGGTDAHTAANQRATCRWAKGPGYSRCLTGLLAGVRDFAECDLAGVLESLFH